ncbi:hypothetical protein CO661_15950 [Sinorhizobium fredii]|uniref:Uncharacterized protein n=1 Tax=Rhizobium fredii TaxID=380 RepID=A0A2A6LWL0_RHIFR|nr:hypothetical protein CO661_15950 [Sinorhizobium fredii]
MVPLHQIVNGVRLFREFVTACHESRGVLDVKRLTGQANSLPVAAFLRALRLPGPELTTAA